MTAKQQTTFHAKVKQKLKEKRIRMEEFYSTVNVSPTHWHFINGGGRVLTTHLLDRVNSFLKSKKIELWEN